MAHILLRLKLRPVKGNAVRIPVEVVRATVRDWEKGGGQQMLEALQEGLQQIEESQHDAQWLLEIASWTPANEGLKLTDAVRWFPLIQRLQRVDQTREAVFKLSAAQADLIFERLKADTYKLRAIPPNYAAFILDLFEALGRWPDSVRPEDRFDEEEEGRSK